MSKLFKRFGIILLLVGFIGSTSLNFGILGIASVGYAAAKIYETVSGRAATITKLDKEKKELSQKNKKLVQQKVDLDSKLTNANKNARRLNTELDQKNKNINELNGNLKTLKNQQIDLESQLDETVKRQLGLSDELAKKSNKLAEITDQFLENEAKIGSLETEISKKNKKIALIDDQLRAARKSLDNSKPMDRTVLYRGKRVAIKEAIIDTNDRIAQRTAFMASRNLTSIPAEAIPYLGIAVILSVTAYDLYDSCDTIKDLHELTIALDPSRKLSNDQTAVCGMEVPSTDEIWEKVKKSPGEAYSGAFAYSPGLPEFEMPFWFKQILE